MPSLAADGRQRLGEVVDVLALPGWVAVHDDRLVGVATFRGAGERAELAAIVVGEGRRHSGLGSALLEAAVEAAYRDGARELWLVTTNDNIDALRFYQRRGSPRECRRWAVAAIRRWV